MPDTTAAAAPAPLLSTMSAELLESLERHRAILDTAADGIITIDAEGTIVSFNRAAERMFGYTEAEIMQHGISELMPEPYRSQHDGYLRAYLQSGQAKIIGIGREVEGRRKDGSVFPMDLSVGEVHLPGRLLFTGITRDISERRAMETEARRRLNDLAHVSRLASMGEMATVLAHEVNQPLTAIISHATACLRMLANQRADPAVLQESLAQIARQGERAGEVIKRLRRFVHKGDMELKPGSLNGVVREVLWLVGHELRAHGVNLRLELTPELPAVPMDRVQIEQVVFNLVRNAAEAMESVPEEQRELFLTTGFAELRGQPAIALCAEDRGAGFGALDPTQLFEPYFTTKSTGLGQGLAICKSIIEAHEGSIHAAPSEAGGARFCITLPLATA